jgi:hypothetical protein
MVTTGTKHALACGNMTMAWHKWNYCAIAGHTWSNWKTYWMAVFARMRNINCMTSGEAAFGTNAAEEEHQARQITALLNSLANTLIQKNITINNLVTTRAGTPENASSHGAHVSHWHTASHPLLGPGIIPAPGMGSQSTGGSGATRSIAGPNTGNKGPTSILLGLSQTSLG